MSTLFLDNVIRVRPGLAAARVRRVILAAMRAARIEGRVAVTVVWTSDAEVRRLNRAYRGKDRPTDVLSFPIWGRKEVRPTIRRAREGSVFLGDVVVSVPEARRAAAEDEVSYADVAARLVAHGVLHLVGEDHVRLVDRRRMRRLERQTLGPRLAGLIPDR